MNSRLQPFTTKILMLGVALSWTAEAAATNIFDVGSSCTTSNCQSVTINGTVLTDRIDPPSIHPWVVQAFATVGDCVRLQVTRQEDDLKITVISPDGLIWSDDDSGGNLRPLVKIASAPIDGWYTVQIANFAGNPNQADFTLKYGRYFGAGTVNCSGATSSLSESQVLVNQKTGEAPTVRPFEAGSPGR